VTIPAVEIPFPEVPGQPVQPPRTVPEKKLAAYHGAAKTATQKCAQKVRPGGFRPEVFQPEVFRPEVFRPEVFRPEAFRGEVCVEGDCAPAVDVPPISVAPVSVPAVVVPARSLEGKTLPEITSRCVRVLQGGGSTAYNVCSDVLFDFDKADIRPDAEAVLRQVAKSLNKRFAGRDIRIDGHTDSQGSDGYNDRLSVRRAEAVKRWLVANGGIAASRITTKGYGESEPVASNGDDAGRQRNRRVVVGVTKG
jgi:outer membrane protein OmpA-like peptidoglycan-associated protein